MIAKGKKRAFDCPREFGQWLVLSLVVLILGAFPMVGSAADSYVVGFVFFDNNGNGFYDEGDVLKTGHNVELKYIAGNNTYRAKTDENGQFGFFAPYVGNYEIRIGLEGMQLTAPFYADEVMPAHKISIAKQGNIVQVDFGLSDNIGDLFVQNRDNSIAIYNENYGIRVSPKAEGYDASTVTSFEIQEIADETLVGRNNVSEVFLSPNYSTPAVDVHSTKRGVRDGQNDFSVIVGKNISATGEEGTFKATKNPDGSVTFIDAQNPTISTTVGNDGSYTVVDSESPTNVVTADSSGNLIVSDTEYPDTVLSIGADGTQTVVDGEFPDMALVINDDETYSITDQEFPELETVYNPNDGSYAILDTVENITVLVDQQGNYTVIDNESGTCLGVPQVRGSFWKKIGSFINKIAKFVAKVAFFVKKVAQFIKIALPIVTNILKGISIVTGLAGFLTFPLPISSFFFTISAFTGTAAVFLDTYSPAINTFLDKTIDIAGKIETGANIVAALTEPKTKKATRRGTRDSFPTPQEGDDCATPPGIVLDYLTGAAQTSQNVLTWATVTEFDNKGFNVWRATGKNEAGQFVNLTKLNGEMIPAQSDAQWGATYSFTDDNIAPNQTYYYIVEGIDSEGISVQQTEFVAEVQPIITDIPEATVCHQLYGVQDQALNDSYFFVHDFLQNTTQAMDNICKGCDIEAMAIHPITQDIFVASGDDAQGHPKGYLYKLNPETGELIPIGATGFQGVTSLTFDQNAVLWAWAEHQGLGQIDPETGEGTLIKEFSFKVGDLSWSADNSVLYAAIGAQLWQYLPATGDATLLCSGLPRKTEALTVLPTALSTEGYLLLGSHQVGFELHAFDPATCQAVVTQDVEVPFDDVEGLAVFSKACVNY